MKTWQRNVLVVGTGVALGAVGFWYFTRTGPGQFPEPVFSSSEPQLVRAKILDPLDPLPVERTYEIATRRYLPEVKLPRVERSAASYATPEDTFIAQVSALSTLDMQWYADTWVPGSQEKFEQVLRRMGMPANYLEDVWKRLVVERQGYIVLTERAERKDLGYVALLYEIRTPDGGSDRLPMILKEYEGRWLATNEFTNDPAFLYGFFDPRQEKVQQVQ